MFGGLEGGLSFSLVNGLLDMNGAIPSSAGCGE